MSDETLDSLRKAFMKDKENAPGECPMAEITAAYAFGELSDEEAVKAREHIQTCRYCLDMYMDIKLAESDAQKAENKGMEILPGLQQAISREKKAEYSVLDKIKEALSDFFGQGFLKPAVVFATFFVVIISGIFFLSDTSDTPYSIQIALQARTQTGFRGGQPEYKEFVVKSGGVLESDDYFRFQLQIDNDAYVYAIFLDSGGNIFSAEKDFILADTNFYLPNEKDWYQLDQNTGTERLYLLASENKIEDFGKRVEKLKDQGINRIQEIFTEATVKSFNFNHE